MKYALFDVDSLELDEAGKGLTFRPRVAPIAGALARIHEFAKENDITTLFSTCCSGRMLKKSTEEILYIPLEGGQKEWREKILDHRLIYIAKMTFGIPEISSEKKAYSSFAYNKNLPEVIEKIAADEWLVFGNGFDFCIDTTVRGLRSLGQKVTLFSDLFVRGESKYLQRDPEEHKNALLAQLQSLGVKLTSTEDFYRARAA